MSTKNIKRYSELIQLATFEMRLEYLKLGATVGADTFGHMRWLNQKFYHSPEYLRLRRQIVIRDNGCDMGADGYPLPDNFVLHHMNPITVDDILNHSDFAWNPEYLICVSPATHRAIHYATDLPKPPAMASRSPNDTCPWKTRK